LKFKIGIKNDEYFQNVLKEKAFYSLQLKFNVVNTLLFFLAGATYQVMQIKPIYILIIILIFHIINYLLARISIKKSFVKWKIKKAS